ncbi:BTB/POZ fold protein [Metarhizium rileyi]|uniref:BTB/POZ fold protein n=1 Tax=Metarhizium rileyi (strain RCEF 4871) TaxID=1649241 RepID=A0A166X3G9_METRR|nr:BTB/POZ fold protein [Metarhizium rileyi RCEF 4871]
MEVQLCINGDAVLTVGHKSFVVSCEILKIASGYFNMLLSSEVQQSQLLAKRHITLRDDDPEAMDIMLSILHYRFRDDDHTLTPEMLLKVAQHSNKYGCNEALYPWATKWMQIVSEGMSIKEYDCLLTAAHSFGAEERLRRISVVAIRNLPPNFLALEQDLQLPRTLKSEPGPCSGEALGTDYDPDQIAKGMKETGDTIRDAIESVHGHALGSEEMPPMPKLGSAAPNMYSSHTERRLLQSSSVSGPLAD